ncbi:MAG: sulfatase, partial [Massilibacteroides sp.]|nr:sulfatase [Massilibacteroides sp.]
MNTKTNGLLIGSLLLPVVAVNTYSQKQMDRPNILWLVSEDNTVLLNAYGDSHAKTPVIDGLAKEGTVYENAYCTAPVSAAARATLITGMYPTALGTQHMRSFNKWPTFLHMYTEYMKKAGYYCVNNSKEDYNTAYSTKTGWDESSKTAYWENRKPGQPFFQIFNFGRTHESSIFDHPKTLHNSPNEVEIPPYLPDLPEERYDRALYYDRLEQMDSELGEVIARLKKEGLYENTIIFYYGDNGGILGRSKRFMYDNGLHIPLIVRFPKKYQYMATTKPGGREKRLVSFVDFAPTMLSLTNCPIPDYMQGKAFLGNAAMPARKYIYAFRGRMDERYDLCRVIHGKRFKYIRNYMPQRPNGQHLDFLWRAKGIQAWEKAWKQGKCTAAQSKFWLPKEPEEFYDIEKDPYELHNLIGNPFYEKELNRLKKNYTAWLLRMRDTGFLPEGMMRRRLKDQSSY